MDQMNILVTGSTDGIGKETAVELASRKTADSREILVIVHGRDRKKAEKAKEYVRQASGNSRVEQVEADFSSLSQVHGMADDIRSRYSRLDVLINNAGIVSNHRRESEDGYELTFAVNHLAPFLLTNLLLDLIKKSAPSRIINVSSMVHSGALIDFHDIHMKRDYSGSSAYARSKLANLLFTYTLSGRLKGTAVTVNALHPGVINTKLLRVNYSGGRPPKEGARTPVYLAISPELQVVTGKYFVNMQQTTSSSLSYDTALQEKLWEVSEELVSHHL
jgi:NAD(P)-dependent dehydrogenase (short-subunit alcohol dehydrogenase family)